jgi:hypothetical protein
MFVIDIEVAVLLAYFFFKLPDHEETHVRDLLVAARWADAKRLLGKHRHSCQRHSS